MVGWGIVNIVGSDAGSDYHNWKPPATVFPDGPAAASVIKVGLVIPDDQDAIATRLEIAGWQ